MGFNPFDPFGTGLGPSPGDPTGIGGLGGLWNGGMPGFPGAAPSLGQLAGGVGMALGVGGGGGGNLIDVLTGGAPQPTSGFGGWGLPKNFGTTEPPAIGLFDNLPPNQAAYNANEFPNIKRPMGIGNKVSSAVGVMNTAPLPTQAPKAGPLYGMSVGGWGWNGAAPGSDWQVSRNGTQWTGNQGSSRPGGAQDQGWAQQTSGGRPGEWTRG